MILLSLIVPIYNVSEYLPKCLDSLFCQGLSSEEYEIICVNDGSTDDSLDIIQKYAEDNKQMVVITQTNGGLSAARNTGIKAAKGKYILFVDSDDYLEPNQMKGLLDKMESEDLDVLRFNYQNVNDKYEVFQPNRVYRQYVDYRDEITDGLSFLTDRLGFACYAWQFMIKASLFEDKSLLFREGIYFEDTEWTPRMLIQAKRVTSVVTVVYNYLMRSGSITQSQISEKQRKVLDDKVKLVKSLIEQKSNLRDVRWYDGMIGQTVISILGLLSLQFYNEKKNYISQLKKNGVFPVSDYHCIERNKMRVKMINFSPSFYCWFIHLKNKR